MESHIRLNIRDARRYRAMEQGHKARDRGLPLEARPPGLSEPDWWETGWRWRDDQLRVLELIKEVHRLRNQLNVMTLEVEAAKLKGGVS